MSNDDDHERHDHAIHGISIPIPGGLAAMLSGEHDRHHMEVDSIQRRAFAFLDSLDVEGLMVLRRILTAEPASVSNNYFEGQVVTILRLTHKVDPDTGLTQEEALAAASVKR